MNELERIIEQLKSADIHADDWICEIIAGCQDRYIRGYMDAVKSEFNGCWSEDEPEYRESFIERMEGIRNQIP